ncbi:hypothetical protein Tco_0050016, partial [Tanacetum coccineum]
SPIKEAKPVKKAKRVKRPVKKSTAAPTAGVVIRDTPGEFVSNKKAPTNVDRGKGKAPAKADRGKGIELLLDAALLEDAQLKKALKKRREETHKLQASGSSEGADFESEVPDESKAKPSDINESDDVNDDDNANDDDSGNEDDDGNDAHDSERTNSDDDDDDENPSITIKDHDEEEMMKRAEHKKERKGDEEMTDADQNVSQEKSYEQVVEDVHVTLTSL